MLETAACGSALRVGSLRGEMAAVVVPTEGDIASTPPLRQAVGVGDLAEWLGVRPLVGRCLRKLGQPQPPSFSLLLVENGAGLLPSCSRSCAGWPPDR